MVQWLDIRIIKGLVSLPKGGAMVTSSPYTPSDNKRKSNFNDIRQKHTRTHTHTRKETLQQEPSRIDRE